MSQDFILQKCYGQKVHTLFNRGRIRVRFSDNELHFSCVEGCDGDCLRVWVAGPGLVLRPQPRGGGDQPQGRHRPLRHRREERSGWELIILSADCNKHSWDLKTNKNYTRDFSSRPHFLSSSEIDNQSTLFCRFSPTDGIGSKELNWVDKKFINAFYCFNFVWIILKA